MTVGSARPTLRVAGTSSSAMRCCSLSMAVVGAKQPMPRVSKKSVYEAVARSDRRMAQRTATALEEPPTPEERNADAVPDPEHYVHPIHGGHCMSRSVAAAKIKRV